MNNQELIKRIEQLFAFGSRDYIERNEVLNLVKQLDEPKKVKIPEFAADVIEGARGHSSELEDALHYTWDNGTKEFTEWYRKKSNRDLFARAWLDGYEVEKEKRYLVKLKNNSKYVDYLVDTKENGFRFYSNIYTKRREHTRKELEEAGFGWVFSCEGVEVNEVK